MQQCFNPNAKHLLYRYIQKRTQWGLVLKPLELDILQNFITWAKEVTVIVFAYFCLVNLST